MASTLSPSAGPGADAARNSTGARVLIALHVEDDDAVLADLAARLPSGQPVTLLNIRPFGPPSTLPPSLVMSDLGVMMYDDWREATDTSEAQIGARLAARSALLSGLGIEHDVETVTCHPSVFPRRTRQRVDRAVARVARRVGADVVLTAKSTMSPPGPGVGDRCRSSDRRAAQNNVSPTPDISRARRGPRDETRRLLDELWIDLGGSG